MQKVFVASDGFEKYFSRKRAKGHVGLVIEDSVQSMYPIEIVTDEDKLSMRGVEVIEGETECYTILCKEFGLVGTDKVPASKVSVIYLDDGWMLVTLHSGGLVVRVNDKLVLPTVGSWTKPVVNSMEICWVNQETLRMYGRYYNDVGIFLDDIEFYFNMNGGIERSGLTFMKIRLLRDECIDLSQGYIALYEQQQKAKEDAKRAKEYAKMATSGGADYEFDEDDFADEDEEDEEDIYGI